MMVGDTCKEAIVFFIPPLIKYAKPTQLWSVWLSKLSNQNQASYLMAKSVGANEFSYFLFLILHEKIKMKIFGGLKKRKEAGPQKKTIVTIFVDLNTIYGNRAAKSCVRYIETVGEKRDIGVKWG